MITCSCLDVLLPSGQLFASFSLCLSLWLGLFLLLFAVCYCYYASLAWIPVMRINVFIRYLLARRLGVWRQHRECKAVQ
ncbi:hypothetical protein GQ42DRAFT_89292 [Ramicandelaber brevisporus]|nr:hypothetical protein GQ42DRAFT_89292 [Ramicandelaber brevisporus]